MRTLASLALIPALAACGGAQAPAESSAAVTATATATEAVVATTTPPRIWTQRSVEYDRVATQAFQLAMLQLEQAINDPSWTAMVEQETADASLPPAIVLDLDETVMDNSPYQAWTISEEENFGSESWGAWCDAAEAPAVPGALDFLHAADAMGVTIFYISNRDVSSEEATRENLIALGAPMHEGIDAVMLRNEYGDGSSKRSRREAAAATHRVVMMFGDNLGDFMDGYKTTPEERETLVAEHEQRWGHSWFMLPNPQYGSWEGALFGFDYGLSAEERFDAKIDALDAWVP
jgi:5'-nucleotidase (lipoprotein e(P4) family)